MGPDDDLPNGSWRDSDPAESRADSDLSPAADPAVDLESVYARYIGPIYRFLYARVGNREDAEDLTSEAFLKASRQLDVSRSEASIAAWLFTVARTVLADHWRKYYRHGALLPLGELGGDLAERTAAADEPANETEQRVAEILEALPPRYRQVLELRFLRGCSVLETAQELSVSPGNAKILQHRALARAMRLGSEPPPSGLVSCAAGRDGEPGCPDPAA